MKCEVERFERGTELTIKGYINEIENYVTIGQVTPPRSISRFHVDEQSLAN